jgi:protein-L-isoaspartate O-methyltransferase
MGSKKSPQRCLNLAWYGNPVNWPPLQAWMDQLAVGGRVIAPTLTSAGHQALVVILKTAQGFERQVLEAVHFVPLKSGVA